MTTDVLSDLVARASTGSGGVVRISVPEVARFAVDETTFWRVAWGFLLDRLAGQDTSGKVSDLFGRPPTESALLSWQLVSRELVGTYRALDEGVAHALGERLIAVAGRLAGAAPDARAADIPILHPTERRQILEDWNATDVRYRADAGVPLLFRERAAERPDALALVWDGGRMTYADLDRRSDRLARHLLAAGVTRGELVGVALDRSPEAVVAVLAILKAAAAYLPLDLSYPDKRIAFLVDDARARVVIARTPLPAFGAATVVDPDTGDDATTSPLPDVTASDLAYVLYTSGSTGTPKGVQIEHRSIVRLVGNVSYVRLAADTVVLHAAPLGFDASTLELWGPLLAGGAIAVHGERVPTGRGLQRTIGAHGVTTAWLTAALFNAVVDEDPRLLGGLRQLFTGGESLSVSHVRRALDALPQTELVNGYGPTECTTFTTTHPIPRDLPAAAASVPIGRPIADTRVYVLNARREPVPVGVAGELWIGGLGVGRGYLRRPELDAERFAPDTFDRHAGGGRLYRTGDLVRWLPDGTIEFLGRIDQQVKVRGFRIELGEIEAALARQPRVQSGAVVVHDRDGEKRLVAYVVPKGIDLARLRTALGRELPDFMVPSAFVELDALPVTDNGKLDRRALPVPGTARPDLTTPYRAPTGAIETAICRVFQDLLAIDEVGALDNFFELGGNSLLAIRTLGRLLEVGVPEVSAAQFFATPTPAGLAECLTGNTQAPAAPRRAAASPREPIAIIGMAVRLPGAKDVDELWRNLVAGRESITDFEPSDLDPSLPLALTKDPSYVRARGVLEDVDQFDAPFFGMTPLEAQVTDPQHRIFLETAWEALEHAGHAPQGRVGVFAGMYNATYFQKHVMPRADLVARAGELNVMLGNEKDYLTSRVAHKLGLTGPAVNVQTACSTSLVAICQAADSLRRGECEMAIAGGVAVTCPPKSGYLNQEGTMTSPDGRTRTFSHDAAGTVFSDGVAAVVLKPLADALADGDRVYAVVLGGAINNDGAARASFTAPSPDGQAAVIAAALGAAGVDARSIGYVEAHGTGTPIGDPIEIEGLTRAFRRTTQDTGFCRIGSVKSNIGHTVIAAGATGLIKAALALSERLIPATINYKRPNPKIDFSRTPFVVNAANAPWEPDGKPRRAGVSAFGFGGTNAHVVLEEAPVREPSSAPSRPAELLVVSAQSGPALSAAGARLADHLDAHPDALLADVGHTLRVGRRAFAHRRFVVACSGEDAAKQLRAEGSARKLGEAIPDLAFVFPGQGSQYARMGKGLYDSEPAFRAAYDDCMTILGGDAKARFHSEDPGALTETATTQPAVFSLEYALARLLMSLGVKPTAFIGHSVGEFVGAVLAGVMPLEQALPLVALRGSLMQALPPGSMLSVRLPAADLEARLPAEVALAAENGPTACVAAGPTPAIDELARRLEADGVPTRKLVTSHAFHSSMMDPVLAPFGERVAAVRLARPEIPLLSTVSGTWLTDGQATSPRYWTEHLRRPVRFSPAVITALADPRRVLSEAGPRATLSTLARQHADAKRPLPPAIATMADTPETESAAFAGALGRLWQLGVSIDWHAYVKGERRGRVALPTYPFQRQRHWIAATAAAPAVESPAPAGPAPLPPLVRDLIHQQLELMAQQLSALTPRSGDS